MSPYSYCQWILPKVSRTFAINISVLKGDLKKNIMAGYLICRILDTVEDDPSLDNTLKCELLNSFIPALIHENWEKEISKWVQKSKKVQGSPDDLNLLSNTELIAKCFHELPLDYQKTGIPYYIEMAQGMSDFATKFSSTNKAWLKDNEELEKYCYFVAGTVGLFLVEAFSLHYQFSSQLKSKLLKNAVSFGLGLQMTNIAKDIQTDRERGWTFVPKSYLKKANSNESDFLSNKYPEKNLQVLQILIYKAFEHLNRAYIFTRLIPLRAIRVKLFCLWPLWMAMKTLDILKGNLDTLNSKSDVKMTRKDVKRILFYTTFLAPFNFLLGIIFKKFQIRLSGPSIDQI